MERTSFHDLSRDELIGLILRLQKQLADQEQRNREVAERNHELARRIEELEKKNPTVRLDEAYSLRAVQVRRMSVEIFTAGVANHQWSGPCWWRIT